MQEINILNTAKANMKHDLGWSITICVFWIDNYLAFPMLMVDKGILHACYLFFYTQEVKECYNVVTIVLPILLFKFYFQ